MAKNETKNKQAPTTVSAFKQHYDPIEPQTVELNGTLYYYSYDELTFEQVMLAEELANLKRQRLEAFADNTNIPDAHMDMDYIAELTSILFVESPDGKPKEFSRIMKRDTAKNFKKTTGIEKYEQIERCLRDFFIRRGKRTLVSTTITKSGSLGRMMPKMLEAATEIYSKMRSESSDSSSRESSTGEAPSDSDAPPSKP